MRRFCFAAVGGLPWLAGILATAPVCAGGIFWVQGAGADSRVVRSDLNGSNVSSIVTPAEVSDPTAIAVDAVAGKVYWTDGATNQSRIRRSELDGASPATVLAWPLKSDSKDIDVDPIGAKLYWAEGAGTDSRILRVGLTGLGFQPLLDWPQVIDPKAIAVDPIGGKFYWAQGVGNDSRILRANLDGTGVEPPLVVWPQVSDPTGIAVNPADGKLYWCQSTGNNSRILTANLDGSSPATVLSWPQVLDPKSVSLDLLNLKMYWAEGANTSTRLVRAGLGGSGVETIVAWPQLDDPVGLALDREFLAPPPAVVPDPQGVCSGGLQGLDCDADTDCGGGTCVSAKSRFLSIKVPAPAVAAGETAIEVTSGSLHHVSPPYTNGPSNPFTSYERTAGLCSAEAGPECARYVGPPTAYPESEAVPTPFLAAKLQCTPNFQIWPTGTIHVYGAEITPSSVYDVKQYADAGGGSLGAASTAVQIPTGRWGDVDAAYQNPAGPSVTQPDAVDIGGLVAKFRSQPSAPIKAQALLEGNLILNLAQDLGFNHISQCVNAFRGKQYPHDITESQGPCVCPSTAVCPALDACGRCTP